MREISVQGPVLLGDEGLDVGLPLAHHPGGHGLDPPGGKTPADLLPQQGGDLIAHDAVQHPARLLGVHQIHIDGPGVGDGVVDHLLGDLVEGHPVGLVVRDAQHLLQVPGDGLALPVGVGGEEHFLALLGGFFQLVNELFLALDGLVVQFKAVLHVHAQLALGQVAHVAHGGLHLIARAQIFADGLGLRRRLDDHQIRFCHSIVLLTYLVVKADGSGKPLAGKLIQIALSLQQGQGSVHPPGGNLGAAHDLVGAPGRGRSAGRRWPAVRPPWPPAHSGGRRGRGFLSAGRAPAPAPARPPPPAAPPPPPGTAKGPAAPYGESVSHIPPEYPGPSGSAWPRPGRSGRWCPRSWARPPGRGRRIPPGSGPGPAGR